MAGDVVAMAHQVWLTAAARTMSEGGKDRMIASTSSYVRSAACFADGVEPGGWLAVVVRAMMTSFCWYSGNVAD